MTRGIDQTFHGPDDASARMMAGELARQPRVAGHTAPQTAAEVA